MPALLPSLPLWPLCWVLRACMCVCVCRLMTKLREAQCTRAGRGPKFVLSSPLLGSSNSWELMSSCSYLFTHTAKVKSSPAPINTNVNQSVQTIWCYFYQDDVQHHDSCSVKSVPSLAPPEPGQRGLTQLNSCDILLIYMLLISVFYYMNST